MDSHCFGIPVTDHISSPVMILERLSASKVQNSPKKSNPAFHLKWSQHSWNPERNDQLGHVIMEDGRNQCF